MTDDERDALLIEIKNQTTLTNGRVTRVEETVNGYEVGTRRVPGLVEKAEINQPVIDAQAEMNRRIKQLLGLIGATFPPLTVGVILLLLERLSQGAAS